MSRNQATNRTPNSRTARPSVAATTSLYTPRRARWLLTPSGGVGLATIGSRWPPDLVGMGLQQGMLRRLAGGPTAVTVEPIAIPFLYDDFDAAALRGGVRRRRP